MVQTFEEKIISSYAFDYTENVQKLKHDLETDFLKEIATIFKKESHFNILNNIFNANNDLNSFHAGALLKTNTNDAQDIEKEFQINKKKYEKLFAGKIITHL